MKVIFTVEVSENIVGTMRADLEQHGLYTPEALHQQILRTARDILIDRTRSHLVSHDEITVAVTGWK